MASNEIFALTTISDAGEILSLTAAPLWMTYEEGVSVARQIAARLVLLPFSGPRGNSGAAGKSNSSRGGDVEAGDQSADATAAATSSRKQRYLHQQGATKAGFPFLIHSGYRVQCALSGNFFVCLVCRAVVQPSQAEAVMEGLITSLKLIKMFKADQVAGNVPYLLLTEEIIHNSSTLDAAEITALCAALVSRPDLEPTLNPEYSTCEYTGGGSKGGVKDDADGIMSRRQLRQDLTLQECTFSYLDDGIKDDHAENVFLDESLVQDLEDLGGLGLGPSGGGAEDGAGMVDNRLAELDEMIDDMEQQEEQERMAAELGEMEDPSELIARPRPTSSEPANFSAQVAGMPAPVSALKDPKQQSPVAPHPDSTVVPEKKHIRFQDPTPPTRETQERSVEPTPLLFLHGFGQKAPERCHVYRALTQLPSPYVVTAPCYHPCGNVANTRLLSALADLEVLIDRDLGGGVGVVGYSVGGLLASLLAVRRPDLVRFLVLLAPAIDNSARNYDPFPESQWSMPAAYVRELKALPPRPSIDTSRVPTVIFHGDGDTDGGGSAMWRMREWAEETPGLELRELSGVDHSLRPWIGSDGGAELDECIRTLAARGAVGDTQQQSVSPPIFQEHVPVAITEAPVEGDPVGETPPKVEAKASLDDLFFGGSPTVASPVGASPAGGGVTTTGNQLPGANDATPATTQPSATAGSMFDDLFTTAPAAAPPGPTQEAASPPAKADTQPEVKANGGGGFEDLFSSPGATASPTVTTNKTAPIPVVDLFGPAPTPPPQPDSTTGATANLFSDPPPPQALAVPAALTRTQDLVQLRVLETLDLGRAPPGTEGVEQTLLRISGQVSVFPIQEDEHCVVSRPPTGVDPSRIQEVNVSLTVAVPSPVQVNSHVKVRDATFDGQVSHLVAQVFVVPRLPGSDKASLDVVHYVLTTNKIPLPVHARTRWEVASESDSDDEEEEEEEPPVKEKAKTSTHILKVMWSAGPECASRYNFERLLFQVVCPQALLAEAPVAQPAFTSTWNGPDSDEDQDSEDEDEPPANVTHCVWAHLPEANQALAPMLACRIVAKNPGAPPAGGDDDDDNEDEVPHVLKAKFTASVRAEMVHQGGFAGTVAGVVTGAEGKIPVSYLITSGDQYSITE